MYDVLVKSVIFGTRNADKIINQGDTGRIFADMGQWTNAVNAVTKLDNTVGKGAKTAINAMAKASESNKALSIAGKGLNWASKNVNPLLIGAAGYRVCKAEDKEAALKREIFGMTTMFGAEGLIKEYFKSGSFLKFKNAHPKLAPYIGIAEGLLFVAGSIAASTTGYKIGKYFFPDKETKSDKLIKNIEKIDKLQKENEKLAQNNIQKNPENNNIANEYFLLSPNKKVLA